jgi:hypothetical protein
MRTESIRGLSKNRAIGTLLVFLSVTLLCGSGCMEEQPVNLSECINRSLTKPISPSEAVIVALADPEVAGMLENYSVDISVEESTSLAADGETYERFHSVKITRYNLITHEQASYLLVDITYDGRVDGIGWEPPIHGPPWLMENLTAENTTVS